MCQATASGSWPLRNEDVHLGRQEHIPEKSYSSPMPIASPVTRQHCRTIRFTLVGKRRAKPHLRTLDTRWLLCGVCETAERRTATPTRGKHRNATARSKFLLHQNQFATISTFHNEHRPNPTGLAPGKTQPLDYPNPNPKQPPLSQEVSAFPRLLPPSRLRNNPTYRSGHGTGSHRLRSLVFSERWICFLRLTDSNSQPQSTENPTATEKDCFSTWQLFYSSAFATASAAVRDPS